jgi:hypothetical protein
MMRTDARAQTRTVMNEQKIVVGDLVRRVESLMSDARYPPLYTLRASAALSSRANPVSSEFFEDF